MSNKPRYKMKRLGDLKDGTRFWSFTSGRRYIDNGLIRTVAVPRVPWEGRVCYQCVGCTKVWAYNTGSALYPNKDRLVFVEADNV